MDVKELRKREKRLEGRLDEAEKALEAITNKIEGGAKKDSQEMDRAIATMINGKRERQTLAKAHLAECATLSQDLGTLVQTMVEMRKSSLPVLARTIEERIDTVREAVLTEVAALKSRPGGLAGLVGRYGDVDPMLQEQLEHHDAAMKMSDDRLRTALQSKFDEVHQALLREKRAREDDAERLLSLLESTVSEIELQQTVFRREQEASEMELLIAVRELSLIRRSLEESSPGDE